MTPQSNPLIHSKACTDLIKRSEDEAGFLAGHCTRLKAYRCPAGVWTIGWGTTAAVHEGMEITPGMADIMLNEELEMIDRELNRLIKFPVTQGQWDALASLAFNCGADIPTDAPKLWAALKRGDKQSAAHEFLDITKGGGVVLPGLVTRRKREAELFLS